MKKLRLAYFGTPDFSAHFLENIISDKDLPVEVVLVVTQPDRPVGRKQILTPTPVKEMGLKYGFPVMEKISNFKFQISNSCDLGLVYAYGEILPKEVLDMPRFGFWNIHPSLLPKYRGPSPMAFPLLLGDNETGVTLIKMDEEMDHGPIIAQKKYEIKETDKRSDLETKLTDLAYELFKETLHVIPESNSGQALSKAKDPVNEILRLTAQNDSDATYTSLLKKEDGFIPIFVLKKAMNGETLADEDIPTLIKDYFLNPKSSFLNHFFGNWKLEIGNSAKMIFNYFRGLYPWPGIWTKIRVNNQSPSAQGYGETKEKRLKITDVNFIDNKLLINRLQLEGKSEVDFLTFNRGYSIF